MHRFALTVVGIICISCSGCIESESSSEVARDLFDLPTRPTPESDLKTVREPNGYYRYRREFHELLIKHDQPGYTGRQIRIMIPDDPHATSLPCLFYNPPGATVCTGKSAGNTKEDAMVPYVNAGFAVVMYGTAGGTVSIEHTTSAKALAKQALLYAQSHAGLINARDAIDFALREFPVIDPERLYAIGHSSGGKQALLMTAADPRISGCVAWAPACDVSSEEKRMIDSLARVRRELPVSILHQSNPSNHADRINVPLLLVHSTRDDIVPSKDVVRFGEAVGSNAEIQSVNSEDHFDVPDVAQAMTIRWLTRLATANGGQLARVQGTRSSHEVRSVSRSGRRSTSSQIQSNPYAN